MDLVTIALSIRMPLESPPAFVGSPVRILIAAPRAPTPGSSKAQTSFIGGSPLFKKPIYRYHKPGQFSELNQLDYFCWGFMLVARVLDTPF